MRSFTFNMYECAHMCDLILYLLCRSILEVQHHSIEMYSVLFFLDISLFLASFIILCPFSSHVMICMLMQEVLIFNHFLGTFGWRLLLVPQRGSRFCIVLKQKLFIGISRHPMCSWIQYVTIAFILWCPTCVLFNELMIFLFLINVPFYVIQHLEALM